MGDPNTIPRRLEALAQHMCDVGALHHERPEW